MRLLVEAQFLPGLKLLSSTTGLQISLAHGGKTVMEGEFELSVPKLGGEQTLRRASLVTPPFSIDADGDYIVFVRSTETKDINYARVEAVIRSRVEIPDNRIRDTGYAALALGVVLLLFSGLGHQSQADPSQKPARRWGRG
ncbi:MAG: hypothetical protein R3D29_12755 [Nitratireductor sp.]